MNNFTATRNVLATRINATLLATHGALLGVLALSLICLASGCGKEEPARADAASQDSAKSTTPSVVVAETKNSNIDTPIDYSKWKPFTEKPKRIPLEEFSRCIVFAERRVQRDALDLHFVPMVKVFANPAAWRAVAKRNELPLPVGAVIVKEKWLTRHIPGTIEYDRDDRGPGAYAAMIKREAGYDSEHGDWEYVYVARGADSTVERGHLSNCRECHSKARDTDYLFLPDPASDLYPDE